MLQQINLYQSTFRKQEVVFSALTMLQAGVFFLLVFSFVYVYQAEKIKPYKTQLAAIEKELTELNKQVIAMETSQKSKGKSKLLENEIEKLSKELEQRERISIILASRSFGNSSGFSSYLESFARGHVEGTWLTDVDISQGGTLLGLKGKTLSSELVPVYIQRLAEEKSLQGASFNVMELARVEKEEGESEISFLISTN
jgi:Tfp pilus assembly protein PilN